MKAIGEQIRTLSESEEDVTKLRAFLEQAGGLARSAVSGDGNPDTYYSNHLVQILVNNAKDTGLYPTYADCRRKTILFNRCQRYALSDIKTLVEHLESL